MIWALLATCRVGADTVGGRCLRLLSSTNHERKVVRKLSLLRFLPSFPFDGDSSTEAEVEAIEVMLFRVPCDVEVGSIGGDGAFRGTVIAEICEAGASRSSAVLFSRFLGILSNLLGERALSKPA